MSRDASDTPRRFQLLNDCRIGEDPAAQLKSNPTSLPPFGFSEVTTDTEDTTVSPHFTLRQSFCTEDTTKRFPNYMPFKERLPLKLEAGSGVSTQ